MKKIAFALLSFVLVIDFTVSKAQSQPPPNKDYILQQTRDEENKVHTGILHLLETITHKRQTDDEVRNTVGAGSALKGALQIEKETPRETKGKRSIVFANKNSVVLIENSDNHQTLYQKVYFDKIVTKNYLKAKNVTEPDKVYSPTYTVTAPLPKLNDYNLLWTEQFWKNMDVEKASFKQGENGLIVAELPPHFGHKRIVQLDPKENYGVKNITMIDLKLKRTRYEINVVRKLRDGIWYPNVITETTYDVNAPNDGKVTDEKVATVYSAALNIPITAENLDFGAIPINSFVTDNRFNPPLSYEQRTHQFTDAELRKFSTDPQALIHATAETNVYYAKQQEKNRRVDFRAILGSVVGIVAGAFLVLLARQIIRRPKQH